MIEIPDRRKGQGLELSQQHKRDGTKVSASGSNVLLSSHVSDKPDDAIECILCKGTGAVGIPGAPCQWCRGRGWDKTATFYAKVDKRKRR